MMKTLFYSFILLLTVSCVSTGGTTTSMLQSMPTSSIEFMDMDSFDTSLSNAMSANLSTITVNMMISTTVNEMPKRLSKWLSAVQERGGKVEVEPKTKSVASVVAILFSLIETYAPLFFQPANVYDVASNYNVIIHNDPSTNVIGKVEFTTKK